MTPEQEVVILRSILKRVQSAMWWARLSFPDGLRGHKNFWTVEESEILKSLS